VNRGTIASYPNPTRGVYSYFVACKQHPGVWIPVDNNALDDYDSTIIFEQPTKTVEDDFLQKVAKAFDSCKGCLTDSAMNPKHTKFPEGAEL
jgi:hypothetical protein